MGWHRLARVCTPGTAAAVGTGCHYETVDAAANYRPLVSTIESTGEVTGIIHPGWYQPDWWDDGPEGRPQTSGHRISLVRTARILHVQHATVILPGGTIRADSRCFAFRDSLGNLAWGGSLNCSLARGQAWHPSLEHAVVLTQNYATQFGHLFTQTLAQLALVLSHLDAVSMAPSHVLLPDPEKMARVDSSQATVTSIFTAAFPSLTAKLFYVPVRPAGKVHARRVSILALAPGSMPNVAIYPRGVLAGAHAAMLHQPPPTRRYRVVYLQRPCPRPRCVINDGVMLSAIRERLRPGFTLDTINPSQPLRSWRELRPILGEARVVLGPHGSAFANAFFANASAPDVHFIEFNMLHGRDSFPRMMHMVGGAARFWTIEPRPIRPESKKNGTHSHRACSNFVCQQMAVDVGKVLNVLVRAGVARCEKPPKRRSHSMDETVLLPCGAGDYVDAQKEEVFGRGGEKES